MSDKPRGWCPFCLRMITLTKDGRLRHHGGAVGTGERGGTDRAYRCAGTARLPRPLPTENGEGQ
jgi:hypothetical protein